MAAVATATMASDLLLLHGPAAEALDYSNFLRNKLNSACGGSLLLSTSKGSGELTDRATSLTSSLMLRSDPASTAMLEATLWSSSDIDFPPLSAAWQEILEPPSSLAAAASAAIADSPESLKLSSGLRRRSKKSWSSKGERPRGLVRSKAITGEMCSMEPTKKRVRSSLPKRKSSKKEKSNTTEENLMKQLRKARKFAPLTGFIAVCDDGRVACPVAMPATKKFRRDDAAAPPPSRPLSPIGLVL